MLVLEADSLPVSVGAARNAASCESSPGALAARAAWDGRCASARQPVTRAFEGVPERCVEIRLPHPDALGRCRADTHSDAHSEVPDALVAQNSYPRDEAPRRGPCREEGFSVREPKV